MNVHINQRLENEIFIYVLYKFYIYLYDLWVGIVVYRCKNAHELNLLAIS